MLPLFRIQYIEHVPSFFMQRGDQKQPIDLTSIFQLKNPTTAFKFGTVAATSIETFFREAPDPVFQRMNLFMKNYNVKTTKEGIQNVLDG